MCFLLRLRRAAQLLADTTGAAAWYLSVTCVHPTAAIAASANKIALQSRCVMRAPLPYLVIEPPCGFRHDYTRGPAPGQPAGAGRKAFAARADPVTSPPQKRTRRC
ncbi:hypothetical protein ADE_07220 [Achromobacter denitrificans]|nr:hypothetical protein ADE_07220 [Achromobacter denitrificans]